MADFQDRSTDRMAPVPVSGADLPFVDEHQVLVSAPPRQVWSALVAQLAESGSAWAGAYGRLVGAEPGKAAGVFPAAGATLPGFVVREVVPMRRVVLAGRHHFSRYTLTYGVQERGGTTLLSARSHARFPGLHGRLYRALVIGSGAHRVIVGRLLRAIARRAQSGSV
jgi:hypothetical protein